MVVNGYGVVMVDVVMSRAVSSVNGCCVIIVWNCEILVG